MIKYIILGAFVSFSLAMLTLLIMIFPMAKFSTYILIFILIYGIADMTGAI